MVIGEDQDEVMDVFIHKASEMNADIHFSSCVKHNYTKCNSSQKMNNKKQEYYPRKNWSSLMLFNCEHPSILNLNLINVSTKEASWLHQMKWASDNEIGEIDKSYNYLINYYNDNIIKALHFTDGGPWYLNYKDCQYSNLWLNYLTETENDLLKKSLELQKCSSLI